MMREVFNRGRSFATVLAVLVFLGLLASPSWAQDVTVGGKVVMRLPAAKSAAVQATIDRLLESGADPDMKSRM